MSALFKPVAEKLRQFESEFQLIPHDRRPHLEKLAAYISKKDHAADLIFICTHNSRRSQLAQIWAQAAARFYGLNNVHCFSGGTEATAFSPNALDALKEMGFQIQMETAGSNPTYRVSMAPDLAVMGFSKTYRNPGNPSGNFAAIMTCSHADQNCPVVLGCDLRVATPYDDPKDFDGTPKQAEAYRAAAMLIGREMTYAMAKAAR